METKNNLAIWLATGKKKGEYLHHKSKGKDTVKGGSKN